jgi:hypothetical protein
MANLGLSIIIWKISFLFFSPPEKPSFNERERKSFLIPNNSDFSRTKANISLAGISSKPFAFLVSLSAALMKLVTVTPGISTGYWKERKIPLCALSSGASSIMFSPSKSISPSVTS